MKRYSTIYRHIAIWMAVFFIAASSFADPHHDIIKRKMDFFEMKESLVMDQKWVPFPDYYDREGWNNFLGDSRDEYIKRGENYLDYKYKMIPASAYLESARNGDRDAFKPYMQNEEALSHLLLAELAEGKGRFMDQIIDGVFALCHINTWSSPADTGTLQPHNAHIIDTEAAQLGNLLAWTYYSFNKEFDKVDPEISRRLLYELRERIMDPFFTVDSFEWTARRDNKKSKLNNTVPWVNGNVLVSFMLLENDRDKLAQAVYYTMQSVDKYLNQVKNAGTGNDPQSRSISVGRVLDYLELLSLVTDKKFDISEEPLIRKMGKIVSRADSSCNERGMLLRFKNKK